jgi:hypothetical protein
MGLVFGAKCENCWERVENCTCGTYVRDDYDKYRGPSHTEKISPRFDDDSMTHETIRDYEKEIDQLKRRVKKLEDELKSYKNSMKR